MDKEISIVIPAYNSENSILELIKLIYLDLSSYFENMEIIVVDDCSRDDTFKKVVEYKKNSILFKNPIDVTVIRLKENSGQQSALLCGIRQAKYSCVATIDDDLQHKPIDIVSLFEAIEDGKYDIAYGLASLPYDLSFFRKIGSKMRDVLFKTLFPKRKNIKVSSLRIMNEKVIDLICACNTKFVYLSAIVLGNDQIKIKNIQFNYSHRKYGKSNYSPGKLIKLYFKILINYSKFPLFKLFRKTGEQYTIEDIQ